ncbi:MAG TPA: dihydroorotate dehydrogenase-like protein [Vicinamibacteria bacterium]|nr:dihydroorotate dehydrogenase-like protein [Vicinamibacteria bacterium]
MDLSTTYLGLKLAHPFVPGASPLADEVAVARRLEDAGAPALVMRSLFEEQIAREQLGAFLHAHRHGESFAEALTYYPSPERLAFGPEEYLDHVRRLKDSLAIPIIASVNGTRPGGWLDYLRRIEQEGADALELNLYRLALDPDLSGEDVEREAVEVVREVKRTVGIPVAVKLSPFFSSFAHFSQRLDAAGADALVLFNRFYQPDIDVENLQVEETLHLSSSGELPLRLRFVAALSGRLRANLAVTGGVHTALDAVKCVMAGAHAVQVVSALLHQGPDLLRILRADLERWMQEHKWDSVERMRGHMNLQRCPDPAAYERANYMLMLHGWR